jgi:tetratricopeptide (TPR) repeat protein
MQRRECVRFRWLIPLILPLAVGNAQDRVGIDSASLRRIMAKADSLYFTFRADSSLALCERALTAGADVVELRWRATRAGIAIGMLEPNRARRITLYEQALRHARRALELAPADREMSYWVAAAAGRRADRNDPVLTSKLGREVYERTIAILAADSLHAGAHHALGQVHAEVLRVPAWLRFMAGRVLRVNIMKYASLAAAERHLRRAVELEPQSILYVSDLTHFLGRNGRVSDANTLAARLATLPAVHPFDENVRAATLAAWMPEKSARSATIRKSFASGPGRRPSFLISRSES